MMLNSCTEKPFSDVNVVGIAILPCSIKPPQNHLAVLYVFDREPELLHIGVPGGLRNNEPNSKFLWIDLGPDFTDIDRQIICAHVKKIADANGSESISYGFDTNAKFIDPETGEFKATMQAIGLTCATFVLEVFESCGFQLIVWDSWLKNQKESIIWQKHMIKTYLDQPNVSKKLLERQQKNIGNRRYLPEEVASATQVEIPAKRKRVMKKALNMRKELEAHYRHLNP